MASRPPHRPDLLSAEETAGLLHLHVKRVQLLARQGKLPAVRHGRRWLFPRDQLLRGTGGSAPREGARGTRVAQGTRTTRPTRGAGAAEGGIEISARNQLRGRVRSIVEDGLMAEVTLSIDAQELVAVITRSSADRLGLTPGLEAVAVVKSTEVMVARARG